MKELEAIEGMTEHKLKYKNSGKYVLATIYAFLERHNILHLFPHAELPDVSGNVLYSFLFSCLFVLISKSVKILDRQIVMNISVFL